MSVRSVTAALLVVAAGCAGPRATMPAPKGAMSQVVLRATSHNWATVNVYVLRGGQSLRVGSVETGQTKTFTVPVTMTPTGDLQVMAHPIGTNLAYLSEVVAVFPGDVVELQVENNLDLSTLVVAGTFTR